MKLNILVSRATALIVCTTFLILPWSLVIPADAHEETSAFLYKAVSANVQTIPPVDTTVTALEQEKLNQEVKGLTTDNSWYWVLWTKLSPSLTVLAGIAAGWFNLYRWRQERRDEQEKRAEERFQRAVTALGNQEMSTRVGAAIVLRTFLHADYKKFHSQIFDLAVAYLRSRKANLNTPEPLGSLDQAFITVFKDVFPLVREKLETQNTQFNPQSLSASGIQLDNAYLPGVDLKEAWLQRAFLRQVNLENAKLKKVTLLEANLEGANLEKADLEDSNLRDAELTRANLQGAILTTAHLEGACLIEAHLEGANLQWAHLIKANLSRAYLMGAHLEGAHLIETLLVEVNLEGVRFRGAILEGANLQGANLRGAYLQEVNLRGANLQGTHPEAANSLKNANMSGVTGLTQEQRDICIKKGAIFDDLHQFPVSLPDTPIPVQDISIPNDEIS